jgi:hypothetical protein
VSVQDNQGTSVSGTVSCGKFSLDMQLDLWDPDPAIESRPWGDFAMATRVVVTQRMAWYEPPRVCATWTEARIVAGSDLPAFLSLNTSGTGCRRTFSLDYELMYADATLFSLHFP